MNSLFLADLMDRNVKILNSKPTLAQASELLNSHHLVLLQNGQPFEVLVRDSRSLNIDASSWKKPLIAALETKALPFFDEHLEDLRPVVTLGPSGSVIGVISAAQLIHNLLKHCEITNSFFETLLDTVNEAVTVVTKEGTVSHWNSVAQDTYSIPQENILGKHITDFFELETLATLKILDEGRPVRQSYHSPRPGTHVLINASPVIYNGTILGAISCEQDVTQIVRLNEKLSNTSSELRDLQKKIPSPEDPFSRIIGKGRSIHHTISVARKISSSEATVLITGESGVGKELFAQAIHMSSPRSKKPLITLNCGAIPAALFESELFGYHGGAFTGAERKGKPGKLELAHGGTLFLDEVGELPLGLQVKLLRVLQDRCFYRLGGTEPITVNTRIIAATNRNLEKMMQMGEFREDLYYRLNVITLEVPPLRERTEDIPELAQTFLHESALKYNRPMPSLDPAVIVAFLNYHWPGNVRELHNVAERLAVLADEGIIETKYLPLALKRSQLEPLHLSGSIGSGSIRSPISFSNYKQDNGAKEIETICSMLERTRGNKTAAAKLLGISRGTLYYKLKQYNLG
ncbi:transcriptional regulatory protein ZraR [Desulfosporosinus acididurans]|uniref:Transcriptional regulatory protein ZraR n=1 Tax=Desulfosporosinus acididurans TaxID=476652 RepID=A0A0J1FQR9_9FIRM|nr:sigma-54-dependent Fis family transcriptional regulator [Desulfosporosinus acididurans]KLU65632.1 transcriptional regulatory protein ZraR [Desulfosporosinus acididurans]